MPLSYCLCRKRPWPSPGHTLWLLTNHGAEERRAHVCLFVREQRMWHACPSQMIGIPGETPLQKCIPSAADAVVSLMITALIKYWRFDEDPSPQEPSHKHKEVTVHMFRPLKGCQDFCLNYLWYVWQYLKDSAPKMKILASFRLCFKHHF